MTTKKFLGVDRVSYADAQIVILPAPFDGTFTYGKGADKGPAAIIDASPHLELYDVETQTEVWKKGIFTAKTLKFNDDPEEVVNMVHEAVSKFLKDDKLVVVLGGEHSISTGFARALKEKYSRLSVLQFDAHGDTREEYNGSKYNHACVMARIRDLNVPIVQVGIRAIDKCEVESRKEDQHVYFAHDIYSDDKWMDDAVSKLTDEVFITFDLDAFDPSIMPSTGTPVPGGLGWYQVMKFLEKVSASKKIVGFDVVELAPQKGNNGPDFLAAKLIYRLLSMIYKKP